MTIVLFIVLFRNQLRLPLGRLRSPDAAMLADAGAPAVISLLQSLFARSVVRSRLCLRLHLFPALTAPCSTASCCCSCPRAAVGPLLQKCSEIACFPARGLSKVNLLHAHDYFTPFLLVLQKEASW
jgi:hypothetical protein